MIIFLLISLLVIEFQNIIYEFRSFGHSDSLMLDYNNNLNYLQFELRPNLGGNRGQIHVETVSGLLISPSYRGWKTMVRYVTCYTLLEQT